MFLSRKSLIYVALAVLAAATVLDSPARASRTVSVEVTELRIEPPGAVVAAGGRAGEFVEERACAVANRLQRLCFKTEARRCAAPTPGVAITVVRAIRKGVLKACAAMVQRLF